jgi:hypothetical protein
MRDVEQPKSQNPGRAHVSQVRSGPGSAAR